jgi:hypothetical protein
MFINVSTTARHLYLPWARTNQFVQVMFCVGRDSVVGIATRYGMEGPGIESRWEARFSAPVQTGPGAHLASYKMGTGSLSRG